MSAGRGQSRPPRASPSKGVPWIRAASIGKPADAATRTAQARGSGRPGHCHRCPVTMRGRWQARQAQALGPVHLWGLQNPPALHILVRHRPNLLTIVEDTPGAIAERLDGHALGRFRDLAVPCRFDAVLHVLGAVNRAVRDFGGAQEPPSVSLNLYWLSGLKPRITDMTYSCISGALIVRILPAWFGHSLVKVQAKTILGQRLASAIRGTLERLTGYAVRHGLPEPLRSCLRRWSAG